MPLLLKGVSQLVRNELPHVKQLFSMSYTAFPGNISFAGTPAEFDSELGPASPNQAQVSYVTIHQRFATILWRTKPSSLSALISEAYAKILAYFRQETSQMSAAETKPQTMAEI